jgi:hypothetical protein
MAHLKVNGFCVGSGGYGVDKTFYQELDAADIPFLAISHDSDPYDAWQVARNRLDAGKENIHTVIYRRTGRVDGVPNYDPNVPDYSKSPYEAAAQHWAYHKAVFPALVRNNRDIIWVITTNEPNKDDDSLVEWLAEFSIHTANMAMRDGYKWAAFGWSGGTPEPRHWRGPRMVEFLRLAAANKGKIAIALHEYAWKIDDIWNLRNGDDYGLVGRFTKLLTACDEQSIPHPDIFITEWGWSEHDVPEPDTAMQHIYEVGELYAQYPAVKGATVWYLGPGYQEIKDKAIKLVRPLKQLILSTEYEDVEPPPPPPPPPGKHKAIVVKLPQTMTEVEWLDACKVAYPFRHTVTASHDDMLTVLRGGNDESFVKASHPERDAESMELVVDAGYRWEPLYSDEPGDPFTGLKFGQPLDVSWVTVKGGEFNAPRDYSLLGGKEDDKHEGIDAAPLVGGTVRTLNVWPGIVVYIGASAGYGNNLIVQHEINDHVFNTRRAHLESISVDVGQIVGKGAVLGICGSTGNSSGKHDHLTMTSIEYGMPGYIVSNVVDPTPYYPLPIEPTPGKVYPVDFLRADPQAWRVIRRADGSGEDIWTLTTSDGFCRVRNERQGAWYSADGLIRFRDTGPKPDSQGQERLFVMTTNGQPGGVIAPAQAEIGKIYRFPNHTQFYSKDGKCTPLSENSGNTESTFQLVDVTDNYTFPTTGFTVDKLYITMQTGEKQLYAIHNGRKIGWVGGGASQAGNEWGGELAELYFDRNIPQEEPNRYCS